MNKPLEQQHLSALIMLFVVMIFLPINTQAFAQTDQAEIEFWQSVKASKDPLELKAYLGLYPQGKFAPLARIRIRKLSPDVTSEPANVPARAPVNPVERITTPPPLLDLPVFTPDKVNVTDSSCQQRLGQHGFAGVDFSGTGYVCLCRAPFEISIDGAACARSATVDVAPPQKKPRKAIVKPRPVKVKKKPKPVRVKRKSVKRPPKAKARSLANSYCRRRYGRRLKQVVVKKSKFYCHYQLELGNNSSIGVKKKKFKNL